MCWMTWLPPAAGRDPVTLRAFVDQLMAHGADSPAGAGAAWVVPGAIGQARILRALRPNLDTMVGHLVHRPGGAWGIFHVRRAPQGNRASKWCHPHSVQHGRTRMLVTYNGVAKLMREEGTPLWERAHGRFYYEVSPLLVPSVIGAVGLDAAAQEGLPNTVVCYEEEPDADNAACRIRIWRKLERFPMVTLACGGVASEGGVGEFQATGVVGLGMSELDVGDGSVMLHDGL